MRLQKENKNKKKRIILAAVAVVLIGGAVASFFIWKNTLSDQDKPTIKTQTGEKAVSDPDVPGGILEPGETSENVSANSGKEPTPDQSTISQGETPQAPSGTFVSNHRPHLSGQPTPNTETSTCTTTPGTTCKITFTNGGTIKELPAQKTDAYGNTHWDWSLQSIGLTVGTWKVKAISTNGSLSASSTDSIDLVVQQ